MNDPLLYLKLNNLSPDLRKEVLDYIDFLTLKLQKKPKKNSHRKFGVAKGFFILQDNFDAPIEVVNVKPEL